MIELLIGHNNFETHHGRKDGVRGTKLFRKNNRRLIFYRIKMWKNMQRMAVTSPTKVQFLVLGILEVVSAEFFHSSGLYGHTAPGQGLIKY